MRLFKFDQDATIGEKIGVVFVPVFVLGLYLFMLLSAFGVFQNFYATACAAVPGWWKILGLAFTAALVYKFIQMQNDKANVNQFMLFILAALSLASFCGFAYPYYL